MLEGEFPFSIEVFTKIIPEHIRTIVVPSGEKITFREERCPGSVKPPKEIWVEDKTLRARCIKKCGAPIEWDEAKEDWVVR